jgi:hypothetical protein
MATPYSHNQAIVGLAIAEILTGTLTDDTIRLIASIERSTIPQPLNHIVGYIQGVNTDPKIRPAIVRDLNDELRIIAETNKKSVT